MNEVICKVCGNVFFVSPSRLTRKSSKGETLNVYCSKECSFKGRHNKTINCHTCGKEFTYYKGRAIKYCSRECFGLDNRGSNNYLWKADDANYRSKHKWIERRLGKANHCEICGLDTIPRGMKRYFQWANISGKHIRDVSDYISLCVKCHKSYDSNN